MIQNNVVINKDIPAVTTVSGLITQTQSFTLNVNPLSYKTSNGEYLIAIYDCKYLVGYTGTVNLTIGDYDDGYGWEAANTYFIIKDESGNILSQFNPASNIWGYNISRSGSANILMKPGKNYVYFKRNVDNDNRTGFSHMSIAAINLGLTDLSGGDIGITRVS